MAERHPSRTILLVPRRRTRSRGSTSTLSVRCFSSGDRAVASEVIWLRLRGDRRAGAGVARAAARDLRPAGVPALARRAAVRRAAVRAARRGRRPARSSTRPSGTSSRYARARGGLRARGRLGHRVGADATTGASQLARLLAGDRASRRSACAARAPRRRCCAAGSRRGSAARSARSSRPASSACASAARSCAPPHEPARSPSDLLSAELDRFGRDRDLRADGGRGSVPPRSAVTGQGEQSPTAA